MSDSLPPPKERPSPAARLSNPVSEQMSEQIVAARQSLGRQRRMLADQLNQQLEVLAQAPSREKADLVLSWVEGDQLIGLVGSDGRSCRSAALDALIWMGFPYALEISPEVLAQVRKDARGERIRRRVPLQALAVLGMAFVLGVALLFFWAWFSRGGR